MTFLEKVNIALRKEENFIHGTCLFNMCPVGQTDLHDDRFWIIECYDIKSKTPRMIGIMVYDNKKEKLYGPFLLKNLATKPKLENIAFSEGNKIGVPEELPRERTLKKYWFLETSNCPPLKETVLLLCFSENDTPDSQVEGFDGEKITFRKISHDYLITWLNLLSK
ncbi:MAG: hypothetical protein WDK96_03025 [Candidatus Paceibacterota bacterium]|jgi:hypothetical protein